MECEVDVFCKIHLANNSREDKLAWHYTEHRNIPQDRSITSLEVKTLLDINRGCS